MKITCGFGGGCFFTALNACENRGRVGFVDMIVYSI